MLGIFLASSNASAQEHETVCEDPRIRIQGRPDERWLEPIVRACEELRSMRDGDATARVRIVPTGPDLIVEVVLKDGRSTLRRVDQTAGLEPTLEALLTVPPAPPHVAGPLRPAQMPRADEIKEEREPLPAPPLAPTFGVELGVGVGGRISGSQAYLSVSGAVFAQIRAGDWLFGMNARWDPFQFTSDASVEDFEMETIGAGIAVARRFRERFGSLDVGVSPRLVTETQSFLTNGSETAATQTDVRIGGFTRATFGHSSWRLFLELDAELSPARIRRDIRIDPALPPLPTWSAGLSVGAVWGQP